jgi:hypothetical protein
MRFIIATFALLITACNIQIRPDGYPAPVDVAINQSRLEFAGCSVASQIGTIACLPGDVVSIVTEFPGDVLYFSATQDCSIREQVRATPPLTPLHLPVVSKICPVMVLYVPEYVKQGQSTEQTYGLSGEVSLQPDAVFTPHGNFAITIDQNLSLTFPGAQHGIFIGRQIQNPIPFQGETLQYKPERLGTDLIQVKLFMQDGTVQRKVIPGNYFSNKAFDLLFDVNTEPRKTTLQFPLEVSAITVTGKDPTSSLKVVLKNTFTGYVRAYTIKGRTAVAYFENGALLWKH